MDSIEAGQYWEKNSEKWTEYTRKGYDVCRDEINTPAFLSILPDVSGLNGIDVGCGEGHNTRVIARLGAKMRGVDIAPNFVKHASSHEQESPLGIEYSVANAEHLDQSFEPEAFDFATSFMCLMDLPDQAAAFRGIFKILKPGGFLQFSILHPCFNTPYRVIHKSEERVAYEVGDYFTRENGEIERWTFGQAQRAKDFDPNSQMFEVPKFHRPLTEWFEMAQAAGFTIDKFHEPKVSAESLAKYPSLRFNQSISLFLIIRVGKPKSS
ncbi:hypothetical protein PPL_07030 [Heterostelium album PN500]|uniref:Methyltransferase type 11 domain-containing protein n=1 Tax=Heterostelium pallidum (strain ATCC 26659 / Pp 5 / PN500) TaxID=670386 RepID=D3BE77_HETP5|nr:hypothetical protein PPL_07030 [Heterostelium album PN500]EFA80208.1 hypothetical protein PPL_07030 [Heterostelium album PN500]|eukprot:XP_020432328.1 hypothetical protein PPL_07030 [Heterostelium album PN500]